MTQLQSNDRGNPEVLRRLREFQLRVRQMTARTSEKPPMANRSSLSGAHEDILARLREQAPDLADSFEQALADLHDQHRRTYVGPAGEAREVMRAAIHLFASEEDVKSQPWFQGLRQGDQINPTQAERLRFAVQQRGGDHRAAADAIDMIDERIGRLGRNVYQRASASFHATNQRQEVRKLTGWVFVVLDEILPE